MKKYINIHTCIIGFISIFVLIFGYVNYKITNERIFISFIYIYFILFLISYFILHTCFKNIKKIVDVFPGIWGFILFLEILYFIIMILLKLFYKETNNIGIYHSDLFIFIFCSMIVSAHYCWYFLRKLANN
jgi:hypothetical protein